MYLMRHAVDALAAPLALALSLSLAAGLLWICCWRRLATALWACAGVTVYALSLVPVGNALLRPLENQYRWTEPGAALRSVHYVVVLGSGYLPRQGVSPVAALDRDGLVRIVEAVRVARRLQGARLILSGGAPDGWVPPARGYAEVASDLGIDPTSLMVLDKPLNTEAEARAIAAAIGSQPFLLVTSAWHMPRAMRLMHRARAQAIPLPTAQQGGTPCTLWSCFLPSSAGLGRTERAIHEYLGLVALDLNLE